MAKKAYVWEEPQTGYEYIVYFDNRNQARAFFADEFQECYKDIKVYRLPWADQYGDADNIPAEAYFENGWWFECSTCGAHIIEMNDFYRKDGGYCCKACYERRYNEIQNSRSI